jgi:hypothetical protein
MDKKNCQSAHFSVQAKTFRWQQEKHSSLPKGMCSANALLKNKITFSGLKL